jgi:hypothetical protein
MSIKSQPKKKKFPAKKYFVLLKIVPIQVLPHSSSNTTARRSSSMLRFAHRGPPFDALRLNLRLSISIPAWGRRRGRGRQRRGRFRNGGRRVRSGPSNRRPSFPFGNQAPATSRLFVSTPRIGRRSTVAARHPALVRHASRERISRRITLGRRRLLAVVYMWMLRV